MNIECSSRVRNKAMNDINWDRGDVGRKKGNGIAVLWRLVVLLSVIKGEVLGARSVSLLSERRFLFGVDSGLNLK